MATSASTSPVQRFDGFEVDPRARELRRQGIRIRIQDQPLEVLLLLLEHKGEVVTREELKQRLWPAGTYVDAEDGLNTAIRKLREHLGDSPERPVYIETIPRRGYRFIASIKEQAFVSPDFADAAPTAPIGPVQTAREAGKLRLRWRAIAGMALVAILVVTVWIAVRHRKPAATQPKTAISSIAVLPLENLSGDPAQDYFADGITEELIGRLSMIRGLRVISRTSSMQFRDPHMTAPEIAKALNVDALVEGSVIRQGNRVRVHAQLIRASNDEHFWSETYDREMGDVLTLESDIAQSIAQKVEVSITGQEHALLAAARRVSPEVYDAFLKGYFANRNTKAGIEQSIAFYEEAIKRDPTYAPAYLGLADAYGTLGTVYGGVPPGEVRSKAITAAQKALELDPEFVEAHVLLANMDEREWQWSESGAEFKRALALSPNNVPALSGSAFLLLCNGRTEEAVALDQRARALDPMNVELLVNNGFHLFLARRFDESIQTLRSALAVQPDIAVAHWFMGYTLIAKGQPEQAIPELERAVQLSDRSPAVIGVLIRAYAHAGRRTDALRMLDELKRRSKTGYVPAGAFINAYLGLGDNEQAFFWLERGYEEKSGIMPLLRVHPHFDPIRSDPRFVGLIHRVGLDR